MTDNFYQQCSGLRFRYLLKPLMKLHMVGPFNGLNIEHRTSNFERPMWMALRFFYFKKVNPRPNALRQSEFDGSF
jgi:hypothetical protein